MQSRSNTDTSQKPRRPHKRSRLRDDSGAALVEFAIVLPMLLICFMGMLVWGYTLSVVNSMYDAARHSARDMAVGSANEVQAVSNAESYLSYLPQAFTVVAEDTSTTGTNDVRVIITSPNALASLVPIVTAMPNLRAEVVMRKE